MGDEVKTVLAGIYRQRIAKIDIIRLKAERSVYSFLLMIYVAASVASDWGEGGWWNNAAIIFVGLVLAGHAIRLVMDIRRWWPIRFTDEREVLVREIESLRDHHGRV